MERLKDRADAGRRLVPLLKEHADDDPLLLALPRGGVPVAFEVAKALGLELDVLVVRKVGAPDQPELAMAAIAQGGVRAVNPDIVARSGVSATQLEEMVEAALEKVDAQAMRFRGERELPRLHGRTVIIVDDGVATGSTMFAALRLVRSLGPKTLVVAVPVLPEDTKARLHSVADQVVFLASPPHFRAVGEWYEEFDQTSDDEVVRLLERAHLAREA